MKKQRCLSKSNRKPRFVKPEIKCYTTKELAESFNFEVFGTYPPSHKWCDEPVIPIDSEV